jgi:hypothetical protein
VASGALALCVLGACAERDDGRQGDDLAAGNFHLSTLAPIMATRPVLVASADRPDREPVRRPCRKMRSCAE